MKNIFVISLLLLIFSGCQDHDSRSTSTGSDSTSMETDSIRNAPGTGFGNSTTDTLGVSKMGTLTDTSGSLGKPDSTNKRR